MKRKTEVYNGYTIESVDTVIGFSTVKRWQIILKHDDGTQSVHKLKTKRVARDLIDSHIEGGKLKSREATPKQRRKLTHHNGPKTEYIKAPSKLGLVNLNRVDFRGDMVRDIWNVGV